MIISKPKSGEYPEYTIKYLNYLPDDINLTDHLIQNLKEIIDLYVAIPNDKYRYRYAENKWTTKEVLIHIIDTERVFAYRALAYARGDSAVLPGFNENNYVDTSNANSRTATDLLDELKTVRLATISLFKSFSLEQFSIVGKTSENNFSVSALAFLIIGHATHHLHIIQDKYLS